MGVINLLSPQMSNLIAAGEVVERPGSVVKEIIENSIDAGSKRIEVEIKNGGITYIRVSDDGCGIYSEDMQKAFLRHATSKIRDPEDMLGISTMGFRGEALAAISAVAKVDVFSRTPLTIVGTQITCEGGDVGEPMEVGCPRGTTITVRDLFYNVPARMKFLKKDSTEGAYCESAVIGAALSHPEISFKFIKDGKESFFSNGDGDFLQVIRAMSGKDIARELLPVHGYFPDFEIYGYVSPPSLTRGSRSIQHFLVNGRPVRGKIFYSAIDAAYKGKIMPGRHPVVFLAIKLPYSAVDVNVHPAKLEVKFVKERDVFSALYSTIEMALDTAAGFPKIEQEKPIKRESVKQDNLTGYQQEIKIEITPSGHITTPESENNRTAAVAAEAAVIMPQARETTAPKKDTSYEDMFTVKSIDLVPPKQKTPFSEVTYKAESYSVIKTTESAPFAPVPERPKTESVTQEEPITVAFNDEIKVIGQIFSTYIIAQQGETMWMIDKHAAHERIIYNKLLASQKSPETQVLLKPISVSLTAEEKQACLDNKALLEDSGFEIEDYGFASLSVRSAPVYINEEDISFVLSDMANKLLGNQGTGDDVLSELLMSIACKAAIKGGSYSDISEMKALAERVLLGSDVRNCPHGRPVATSMTKHELEKQFKRVL